jgi:hypothetical protein
LLHSRTINLAPATNGKAYVAHPLARGGAWKDV